MCAYDKKYRVFQLLQDSRAVGPADHSLVIVNEGVWRKAGVTVYHIPDQLRTTVTGISREKVGNRLADKSSRTIFSNKFNAFLADCFLFFGICIGCRLKKSQAY